MMLLMSVDFPEPFAPSNPVKLPRSRWNPILRKTAWRP